MATEKDNRGAFRIQEFYCRQMDAPIYARLCIAVADGLTRDSRTGARILDWPGFAGWEVLATAHAHGTWIRTGAGQTGRKPCPLPDSATMKAG